MSITPYRVSTITCNGSVNTTVDLLKFFDNFLIALDNKEGFVWANYRGKCARGVYPKKQSSEQRKSFDNQVTVLYRMVNGDYFPNIKVFRNGNLQMTGIRTPEDGQYIIGAIATEIRRIAADNDPEIVHNINEIVPGNFIIRMINSDFSVPYEIRRKNLHKLMISPEYNNKCIFQPGSYPGVKLQYFYNSEEEYAENGICKCTGRYCEGKGTGSGMNQCKKVTICIFESGKILITGANAFDQLNEAYGYIRQILSDHYDLLCKIVH